jgi:hypothetical protein
MADVPERIPSPFTARIISCITVARQLIWPVFSFFTHTCLVLPLPLHKTLKEYRNLKIWRHGKIYLPYLKYLHTLL